MTTHDDLWETEEAADVVFIVGEELGIAWRISAHKLVLSKNNSVFYDMFYSKTNDSTADKDIDVGDETQTEESRLSSSERQRNDNEIPIKDIQPDIFDQLLRFIYCGELNIDTVDSAILFHQAAHKYKIKEIVNMSITYLVENVSAKNVLDIYDCLEDYMDEEDSLPLLNKCAVIIDKAADEVFSTNAFLNLGPDIVKNITSRDSLQLSSELVLFKALLRWSVSECKRRGLSVTNENKRLVLEKIFHNVRFSLLTKQELSAFKEEVVFNKRDKKYLNSTCRSRNSICRYAENKNLDLNDSAGGKMISFTSDKEILLTSVAISNVYYKQRYLNQSEEKINLPIKELKLFKKDKLLIEIRNVVNFYHLFTTNNEAVKTVIHFPECVYVEPKTVYSIHLDFDYKVDHKRFSSNSVWNKGVEYCTIQWKADEEMCFPISISSTINLSRPFELCFSPPLRSRQPSGFGFWRTGSMRLKTLKSKSQKTIAEVTENMKKIFS